MNGVQDMECEERLRYPSLLSDAAAQGLDRLGTWRYDFMSERLDSFVSMHCKAVLLQLVSPASYIDKLPAYTRHDAVLAPLLFPSASDTMRYLHQ